MSPELERLLAALYERDNCEPSDRPQCDATVLRLVTDALNKQPGVSRDEFLDAVESRYREFRRARRKITTLPPHA